MHKDVNLPSNLLSSSWTKVSRVWWINVVKENRICMHMQSHPLLPWGFPFDLGNKWFVFCCLSYFILVVEYATECFSTMIKGDTIRGGILEKKRGSFMIWGIYL